MRESPSRWRAAVVPIIAISHVVYCKLQTQFEDGVYVRVFGPELTAGVTSNATTLNGLISHLGPPQMAGNRVAHGKPQVNAWVTVYRRRYVTSLRYPPLRLVSYQHRAERLDVWSQGDAIRRTQLRTVLISPFNHDWASYAR
jgi:hypothetical protein